MNYRTRIATASALAALLLACGGDEATSPSDSALVATVELDRSALTFADVGKVDTLRAVAKNSAGTTVAGVSFEWTTSDVSIATVVGGIVTTTGLGTAQISATASGKSATASVSIPVTATTIVVDRAQLSFPHIGMRDTLRATVQDQLGRPISGSVVTWSSSNSAIASIDAAGAVTTLGLGTTTITATAGTKTANVSVTVAATGTEWVRCTSGTPTVLLLVEAQYRFPIAAALARYAEDLCAEGYTVWMAESVPATPPLIRAYLAEAWNRSNKALVGAMLIGNIPRAYQYVVLKSTNPNIPDTKQETISYQYYADVNGGFSTSTGFAPAHQFAYDVHDGDMNWELWIGVLPVYKASVSATTSALIRYFDKNHAYRTGGAKPPRAFVNVSEFFTAATNAEYTSTLQFMQTGQYAWTPFSTASNAQFFFASTTPALTVQQGYNALENGAADFFVAESHGFAGAAGQLTIAKVEANPVKTIFFWSSGCSIGDLDVQDNFLTAVLYSATSQVLTAKGSSNSSGGMGNNTNGYYGRNVATAMSAGSSFGAAIMSHVNVPLVAPYDSSREFLFATAIVVGDPTLRLRP